MVATGGVPSLPKDTRVIWTPQPGGVSHFLSCPLSEVLLHGPRGTGKSDALVMDFCQHVGLGFGAKWRGAIFRQSIPALKDIIHTTQIWLPKIWGDQVRFIGGNTPTWIWKTGEELYLRGYERAEDYDTKFHGWNMQWYGFEELTNWESDEAYLKMFSTLRSTDERIAPLIRMRANCNPSGPGRLWVLQRFRPDLNQIIDDSVAEDGRLEQPRLAIKTLLSENQILMKADPGYVDKIRTAAGGDKQLIAAWVYGDWLVTSGGIIDDVWDPLVQIVPSFIVPPEWYMNRAFDWGSSKPWTVGFWAQSNGSDVLMPSGRFRSTVPGDLFLMDEIYGWTGKANVGRKVAPDQISKEIIEREMMNGWYGRVHPGPADNQIREAQFGKSVAHEMGKPVRMDDGRVLPGIRWTLSDKSAGSKREGWNQIRSMCVGAKSMKGQPRERPGLFICEVCKDGWLRTVPTLPRNPKKLDQDHEKSENHSGDMSRYRILSHGVRASYDAVLGAS